MMMMIAKNDTSETNLKAQENLRLHTQSLKKVKVLVSRWFYLFSTFHLINSTWNKQKCNTKPPSPCLFV